MGEFPLDNSWQQKKSDSYFRLLGTLGESSFLRNFQSVFVPSFSNSLKLDFFDPAAIFSIIFSKTQNKYLDF